MIFNCFETTTTTTTTHPIDNLRKLHFRLILCGRIGKCSPTFRILTISFFLFLSLSLSPSFFMCTFFSLLIGFRLSIMFAQCSLLSLNSFLLFPFNFLFVIFPFIYTSSLFSFFSLSFLSFLPQSIFPAPYFHHLDRYFKSLCVFRFYFAGFLLYLHFFLFRHFLFQIFHSLLRLS